MFGQLISRRKQVYDRSRARSSFRASLALGREQSMVIVPVRNIVASGRNGSAKSVVKTGEAEGNKAKERYHANALPVAGLPSQRGHKRAAAVDCTRGTIVFFKAAPRQIGSTRAIFSTKESEDLKRHFWSIVPLQFTYSAHGCMAHVVHIFSDR